MGSSFIITELMLEKNGRKLMLEFFDNIHDKYMLDSFDETKSQRKYYDENDVKQYCKMVEKDLSLRENKITKYDFTDLSDIKKDRLSDDEIKNLIKNKIKNKTIEIEFVYDFLSEMDEKLNLDSCHEFEINEDLLCLKKAFLKAYDLFYHCGHELKD